MLHCGMTQVIERIGYLCYYAPLHKIWGWLGPSPVPVTALREPRAAHAFYGVVGKTLTVVPHAWHNRGSMHALERKKIKHKYSVITINDLTEIWPNFAHCLDQAMLFHMLTEEPTCHP